MSQKVNLCYDATFENIGGLGSFDAKICVEVVGKPIELPKLIEFVTKTIQTGKFKVN